MVRRALGSEAIRRVRAHTHRRHHIDRPPHTPDARSRARAFLDAQPPPASPGLPGLLDRVCCAAAEALSSHGAAVTLVPAHGLDDGGGQVQVVAGSTDERHRRAAEVELDVGEGPVAEALHGGHPVLVPEVGAPDGWRWPAWDSRARDLGIGAVHAFPLQLGAARFGALAAFHGSPFALVPAVALLGVALAALTTELLLERAAGTATDGRPGGVAPLGDDLDLRIEVYQAQGMVMAALGVTTTEALARMRAHAFAAGRDLPSVAADIVAGRVDLAQDGLR